MSAIWNPHATRKPLEDAGSFAGGGHKFLVHTTEGPTLDGAFTTRDMNRDAPHFILEVKNGHQRLVQCIPINRAARGLEHNSGPETNRANCIQVEVVGFTDKAVAAQLGHPELYVANWSADVYRHLHELMLWTHQNFGVPMESDFPFIGQPGYHRLSGDEFFNAKGLVGHCHAAGNSHTDPGAIKRTFVLKGPPVPAGHAQHA
jgi:hypothetical protein